MDKMGEELNSMQPNESDKKEDKEMYLLMKGEIDQLIDNKIMTLMKSGGPMPDINKITKECEGKFFSNLETELVKGGDQSYEFLEQLKEDNIELYEKLQQDQQVSAEKLEQNLTNVKTFSDFRNLFKSPLSKEDLHELYKIGEKWFQCEDFEKALNYFVFLLGLDNKNVDFLIAKGMAEQNLGKYNDAMASYYCATTIDPTNFTAFLQMVECMILMGEKDNAKEAFEILLSDVESEVYNGNEYYEQKIKAIQEALSSAS